MPALSLLAAVLHVAGLAVDNIGLQRGLDSFQERCEINNLAHQVIRCMWNTPDNFLPPGPIVKPVGFEVLLVLRCTNRYQSVREQKWNYEIIKPNCDYNTQTCANYQSS